MAARRMNMQKPTPVGTGVYSGGPARRQAWAQALMFSGHGLARQNSGMEAISPLLVSGVMLAMRSLEAAQRSMASSQPAATWVSALSRMTSRPPASVMPKFAEATKPRFRSEERRVGKGG